MKRIVVTLQTAHIAKAKVSSHTQACLEGLSTTGLLYINKPLERKIEVCIYNNIHDMLTQ